MMELTEIQLAWLKSLKDKEGWPTIRWIEPKEDRDAVGFLRRNELVERKGYSESGMSAYYYLTEEGNRVLLANGSPHVRADGEDVRE